MLRRSLLTGLAAAAALTLGAVAQAAIIMPPHAYDPDQRPATPEPTWVPDFLIGTSPANVNVTHDGTSSQQSETAVAIDPTNPLHIACASNQLYGEAIETYESTDGGVTWPTKSQVTGITGYDPWLCFNSAGDLFFSYEQGNQSIAYKNAGTTTWNNVYGISVAGSAPDRDMVVVDRTGGAFNNSVYIGYDDNGTGNTAYLLYSRTGKGASSWVRSPKINTTGGATIGVNAAVAPDGTVYATWLDYGNSRILTASSTNGAVSWSANHIVHNDKHNTSGFWWSIPPCDTRNIVPFPMTACAQSGPYAGRLYVTYTDEEAGSTQSATYVTYSDDGGVTWASPIWLDNISALTYSWHPQVGVMSDGTVAVSFYGTGGSVSHKAIRAICFSHDGGATWTAPAKVADTVSDEHGAGSDAANQWGDYQGMAADNGSVAGCVWTDNRLGQGGEIYFAAQAPLASPKGTRAITTALGSSSKVVSASQPYVVSVGTMSHGATLSFTLPAGGDTRLAIMDVRGREVRQLMTGSASEGHYDVQFDGRNDDGLRLPAGMYFFRFESNGHQAAGKIVLTN